MRFSITGQTLQFGNCVCKLSAMRINDVRDNLAILFDKEDEVRPGDLRYIAFDTGDAQRILAGAVWVSIIYAAYNKIPSRIAIRAIGFSCAEYSACDSGTISIGRLNVFITLMALSVISFTRCQ